MIRRLTSLAAAAAVLAAGTAQAQAGGQHVVLTAPEVRWQAGPASLPAGAQYSVLYGDPTREGVFAMRLRLPDGYHIPPHTHPRPEIVTVLSGRFHIGMGKAPDRGQARALPAGGFFAFDPGMAHYAYAEGETVIQLNSIGPWAVNYVDPKDDPRNR